jgi:hypothetical protein
MQQQRQQQEEEELGRSTVSRDKNKDNKHARARAAPVRASKQAGSARTPIDVFYKDPKKAASDTAGAATAAARVDASLVLRRLDADPNGYPMFGPMMSPAAPRRV